MFTTVPALVGHTADEADSMVKKVGLALSKTEKYSESAPGTVLEQSPSAGTRVKPGSVVAIVIAKPLLKVPRPPAPKAPHQPPGEVPVPPREFIVPKLIGYNIDVALSMVQSAGLTLQTKEQHSGAEPGTVVAQSPAAGTRVTAGAMVRVAVAKSQQAQPLAEVPNVIGRTAAEAQRILRDAGLAMAATKMRKPKAGSRASAQQAKVVSQSPQPGEMVPLGTAVSLTLAQEFAVVPELIGRDLKTASAMVRSARLTLRVTEQKYSTGPPDIVLEQEPPPGTEVDPGSLVGVVTARPEPRVSVPDLLGRTRDGAAALLQGRQLQLGATEIEQSATAPAGTVFRQDPAKDVIVPLGTAVSIVVAEAFAVVPNLIGHEVATARSTAREAGLGLTIAGEQPSDQPRGTVIRQTPPAGSRVRPDSAVSVYVASQVLVKVPDVVNDSQAEAEAKLRQSRLRPGEISSRVSNAVSPGSVLAQQPRAGEMVAADSAVDLVLGMAAAQYRASLRVDNGEPSPGTVVKFSGQLQPQAAGGNYRFIWGDGTASDWLPRSNASHLYAKAGTYTASLTVRIQGTLLRSNGVQISVRPQTASVIGSVWLRVDRPPGSPGETVKFRAVMEPELQQAEYHFIFGDGQTSGWLAHSEIVHSFSQAGSYQASVVVRAGRASKQSEIVPVEITRPISLPWWAPFVAAGVLAAGGFFVHRHNIKRRVYRSVQFVTHHDMAAQQLELASAATSHPAVRIRAVVPEPDLKISFAETKRGKAAHA